MNTKLYIGNLSFNVTEDQLAETFAEHGTVKSTRLIKDHATGRSKGFGFIEYETEDSAQSAIEGMDGKEVFGRVLKVNEALEKPKTGGPRQARSFSGGGNY